MEAEDATTEQRRPDGPEGHPPAPRSTDAAEPVQETLPFPLDGPVPFALTARARRVVAPESLPSLRVLPEPQQAIRTPPQDRALHDASPVDLDDPNDTRPSQARALRRAGVDLAEIARELDVDELAVRAWVDEVAPVNSARRRLRAVTRPDGPPVTHERGTRQLVERREAADRFHQARAEAHAAARARLADPSFATGLGLVAGVLETGLHAAVVTVRRRTLGAAVVRWLTETAGVDPRRIRVLLRLAPQAPADVAAHAWAEALDLPAGQLSYTRWRAAPDAEAEEATIRIADPAAAARLAGWRDALLERMSGMSEEPDGSF